jgi:type IV secretion system protein VirB10
VASIGRVLVNNATSSGSYNAYQSYRTNTHAAGEQLAATALRNQMNIPPILRKNQGERISMFVRNDLDFSDVYKLSTR